MCFLRRKWRPTPTEEATGMAVIVPRNSIDANGRRVAARPAGRVSGRGERTAPARPVRGKAREIEVRRMT